jgi:hypothetical protein
LDILTYLGYVSPFRQNHLAIYKGDEGLLSSGCRGGEARGGEVFVYIGDICKNL